ncbi:Hypothetical protein FKW44_010513 [Caligus rogercresseyi]|uniref:Uncharacterized protein n=1 Tax=Caligus rogercresseyi TaxID=217165 RepID=A0A7T8HH33_CALRO|nr:Hypothetical protein FKW44_010513 [Caligus rogercresseyi]
MRGGGGGLDITRKNYHPQTIPPPPTNHPMAFIPRAIHPPCLLPTVPFTPVTNN